MKSRQFRLSSRFLIATFAILAAAQMSAAAEPARDIDLSGRWSGAWRDCGSGHHGPLHATFCRVDDCHYRVTFHGRFFGVIPFRYSVVLNVAGRDSDRVVLTGTQRVGLNGSFEYSASASDCEFTSTFASKRYNGRFDLTRCDR